MHNNAHYMHCKVVSTIFDSRLSQDSDDGAVSHPRHTYGLFGNEDTTHGQ